MILEVNDAGEILIPAELVGAAPRERLQAERNGDSLVLKPVADQVKGNGFNILDSLPAIESRLVHEDFTSGAKISMTLRPGSTIFLDTNVLIYAS